MSTSGLTEETLRIGLWLEGPFVSKHAKDFIAWARSNKAIDLASVIVADRRTHENSACGTKSTGSTLSRCVFKCLTDLERILLLKNRAHYLHSQEFDLRSLVPPKIIHDSSTGTTLADLAKLDLLVSLTPLTQNSIPKFPTFGVLALSPFDGRIYRDGPPGFWEVYHREDVTGFVIEHLSSEQCEPRIVLRGYVSTQFYYQLNQASLYQKACHYLQTMVQRVATTGAIPESEARLPNCFLPQTTPSVAQTCSYLGGFVALAFSKVLQKCGADYRWKVGFLQSPWRDVALWQAQLIENPAGHYLADPFVITYEGRTCCFVEDYDIARHRGRIAVYELRENRAVYLGIALQEDFHLSYPYLFHYSGQLYMCPETSEAREVRLYRCTDFPLRWIHEKTIMKNVSAVDTMLFEKDGKWRMLTNIDPAHWGDHTLELCLFSAKTPLDEEWTAHPGNPFFIDASRARNGGMVREGDRLFRVAQGQGFGMYGKQTTINEIVTLDDDHYEENAICTISPHFRKNMHGTHHLNSDGRITVFDFA